MSSPTDDNLWPGMSVTMPTEVFAALLSENERLRRQVKELQRANTMEVERRRDAQRALAARDCREFTCEKP